MIAGMMTFGFVNGVLAEEGDSTTTQAVETTAMTEADSSETASPVAEATETETAPAEAATAEEKAPLNFTGTLKQKFIEGDPFWMSFVLICLVIGMALCIERIVYLNLASINTNKFLEDVEAALAKGGVAEAKELCRNTRGPIASIFYQGLDRADEGIEMVEKSVVSYGGVQMGQLEKGVSWISLFIALAPMLGFMGTVIGMIFAFDKIVEDGQVSPTTVAAGIKVALLTTVFGLIAAIFLQIFYNYIVSKIDGLVNEMENASISLVDMMLKYKITSK
ncbi:biopolymer transport protein ExbB [Lishizhenia tianjinensis]|uniref:Biopolymer transport protein ExbB n=2 Tax=Lishizhenia tianjinensis TaxID=477690 RepID=A0A1I6ZIV3_9FLAO|nr:biopolymer transport protein ExbB [Lishizhenia tianjinensis]